MGKPDLHFRHETLKAGSKNPGNGGRRCWQLWSQDLGKSPFEGYSTEIAPIMGDIKYMRKNPKRLARPRQCQPPWVWLEDTAP